MTNTKITDDKAVGGMDNNLLSVSQVAARLGVSRQRVFELITKGRLPATKVGEFYVITLSDVVAFEERRAKR
jgi:excisionase family DNA binding protein